MANHVTTAITINATTDIILYLKKVILTNVSNDATWNQTENLTTLNLFSLLYKDWPTEDNAPSWPDRTYMMDNVGAKWCYLNDYYFTDDTIELYFESAWAAPESLIYHLTDHINDKFKFPDSEFEMQITAEDENYCHVSGGYANQFGCEFYCDHDTDFMYPDPDDFDSITEHDDAIEQFYEELQNHKMKLLLDAKEELKLYP